MMRLIVISTNVNMPGSLDLSPLLLLATASMSPRVDWGENKSKYPVISLLAWGLVRRGILPVLRQV